MNPAKPQLPKWAIALMVVPFGITFYWMITYTGPYRYLAELQLKWFGEYVPKLTFLLIIVGWVLVGAVIGFLVRGAERPVASMQMPATVSAADVKPEIHVPEWFQRYFRLAGALALMGVGGWFYYNGTHTGSLQQLDALDFQSGKVRARVLYAQVRGHLSQQYLTDGSYLYIPMASEKNSTAPVQLVVGATGRASRSRWTCPRSALSGTPRDGPDETRGAVQGGEPDAETFGADTSWSTCREHGECYGRVLYQETITEPAVFDLRSDPRGGLASVGIDLDAYPDERWRLWHVVRDVAPAIIRAHGYEWTAFRLLPEYPQEFDEWVYIGDRAIPVTPVAPAHGP